MKVLAATEEDIKFFCAQVEYYPHTDIRGMKLVDDQGSMAIVAFDGWTAGSAHIHVWIRNGGRLTRFFIQEVFRYIFDICKRDLVIGITPGYNHAALELNRRIGLKETYRVRDGWALGTDLVIQEMRREQCRWLTKISEGAHGQEVHSRST